MTRRMLSAAVVLVCACVLTIRSDGATITWSNSHPEGPALAMDCRGNPLWGTTEFGAEPDLSLGALVQLWQAVGDIDDPRGVMAAYESTDWAIDDVPLGESHMGFGTFTHPNGSWSDTGDYAVNEGDTVYVRAYNLSKPQFVSSALSIRGVSIRNNVDEIVFQTVGDTKNPQTLYFDHLRVGVPEPSAVLLVIPGLVVWAMRKRR